MLMTFFKPIFDPYFPKVLCFELVKQGFPNGAGLVGGTISTFLGQNSGGDMGGGQADFSGKVPPTRGNPVKIS